MAGVGKTELESGSFWVLPASLEGSASFVETLNRIALAQG
jgi:hypothetical protein